MYGVELYAAVRLAVVDEGLSHHEAGRRFGIDRRTVKKMLSYSAPPGYRRTKPVRRPKLDGFTGIVDAILEADTDPEVPRKQRHTAHRIFERLRDEHGFSGGYTIVKDYVRSRRQSVREAFVPLHHPPGHAQVDFGEATVEVGGRREKVAFFCLILPHSNVWFVKAYPDFVEGGLAGRLLSHGNHRLSDVFGSGACPPRFMGQRSSPEVRRKPRTPLPHGCPVTAGTSPRERTDAPRANGRTPLARPYCHLEPIAVQGGSDD